MVGSHVKYIPRKYIPALQPQPRASLETVIAVIILIDYMCVQVYVYLWEPEDNSGGHFLNCLLSFFFKFGLVLRGSHWFDTHQSA